MAWLDDRAWCHPKLVDLSDRSFRVYVNSISYSSGMGLRGRLSGSQQRLLGADKRITAEIVNAGLWHHEPDGSVAINDWDEHNGKRDDRRAKDRERKRELRKQERLSAGTSAGQSAGRSAGAARVEGSEGSDGSEGSEINPRPLTSINGRHDERGRLRDAEEDPNGLVSGPGKDHRPPVDPDRTEHHGHGPSEVSYVRALVQEQLGA